MSGKQENITLNEEASTSGTSDNKALRCFRETNMTRKKKGKKFTKKDREKLHYAIKNGKINGVKEFIRKFPFKKVVIHNDVSAMLECLLHFQFNIFELLRTNNFRLGPDEEKTEVLNRLKGTAFKKNLDNLEKSGYDNLTKLVHKCGITLNSKKDEQKCFTNIWKALLNLNEIPQIRVLLDILASCSDLQIAFDFEYEHIGNIDPKQNKYTLGCFHKSIKWITIGAIKLLDQKHCHEVYGTMAHEFCHCAMEYIFNNDCKPYTENNTDLKQKYEKALCDCKEKKNNDKIIENAFSYDEKMLHAELIVRVPHILAEYQQNQKLLNDAKNKFKLLFDYYNEDMLPVLKDGSKKLKIIDARKNANEATGVLTEMKELELRPHTSVVDEFKFDYNKEKVYQSNCIEFTMKIMYNKLMNDKNLDSFIFTNQEILDNAHVLKACVEAVKCDSETKIIIACETIDLGRIEKLKEKFLAWDGFIIIANKISSQSEVFGMTIHQKSHKFSDLSHDSPILNNQIDFQGIEKPLYDFLKEYKDIIDIFPIDSIRKGNSLKIGKKINFDKNHVIRKYESTPDSKSLTNKKLSDDAGTRKYILLSDLLVNGKTTDNKSLTYKELRDHAETGKAILLSDAPGNGKTTEFQYLANQLKESFPFLWVLYFDLKAHVKSFSDQKHSDIFNSNWQLAEFFASELLKLESYEAKFFTELFISDRAVILLDGFDEVSPTFEQFMTKLVVAIREKTKNMMWIATRPLYEKELVKKLNAKVFRLSGINVHGRKLFFQNIYKNEKNSDRDLRTTYKNIENLMSSFKREIKIQNPLLLKIIATVVFKNHESIDSYNNMYKLYNLFVINMFIEADEKQAEDVKQDIAEILSGKINMKSYHQKAALEMLWRDDDSKSLISLICDDTEQIPLKTLNRFGLMYYDGSDFYFIHKTFAEFFAAQVICENLFSQKKNSPEIFKLIFELFRFVINTNDCDVIRKFIDMFLIDCKGNYDQFMISSSSLNIDDETFDLSHVATDKHSNLFDLISFILIQHPKIMQGILLDSIAALFAFEILSTERIKLHFESFEDDAIRKILTRNYRGLNCLFAAAANENKEVLEYFLDFVSKKLSGDEISTLFTISGHRYIKPNTHPIIKRLGDTLNKKQFEEFVKINFNREYFVEKLIMYAEYETISCFFTKFCDIVGVDHVKNILRQQMKNKNSLIKVANSYDGRTIVFLLTFFKGEELKDVLLTRDLDNKNILLNSSSSFEAIYELYVNTCGIEYVKTMIVSNLKSFIRQQSLTSRRNGNVEEMKGIYTSMKNKIDLKDLFEILMELPDIPQTRIFSIICFPEIMKICQNSEPPQILNLLRKVMTRLTFEMIQKLCLSINLNKLSSESSDSFFEFLQFLVKLFDGSLSHDEKHEIVRKGNELKEGLFVVLLSAYINHYELNYDFDDVMIEDDYDDVEEIINKIEVSEKIKEVFGANILKLLIPYCLNSKSILEEKKVLLDSDCTSFNYGQIFET